MKRTMATATRAMATRVMGKQQRRGQLMAMVTAKATTWVIVMVTRLAGNKEGKGKGGKGDGDDDGDSNGSGNKGDNGGSGGGSRWCCHHCHFRG
jgi:uncharacterized membrane protein YgcG